jgi:hypothetical protein
MIYALPGSTFTAVVEGFAAQPGVRIEKGDGTNHTPRTTAGVVDLEAGSQSWAKSNLVAPTDAGTYIVMWDQGGVFAAEELVVTSSLPVPGGAFSPAELYATSADLDAYNTEQGTPVALPSVAAEKSALIVAAQEDLDGILEGYVIEEGTYAGRKVDVTELTYTEARSLRRATCAQAIYRLVINQKQMHRPILEGASGPDFSHEGAIKLIGPATWREIAPSGLALLTATLGRGRDKPPWYGFSYADPDEW